METAREEWSGIRCLQADNGATYRDPQFRDEGDGTLENDEDGCSDGIACTVFVGG